MKSVPQYRVSFSSLSPWRAISLRRRDDFSLVQLFVLRSMRTALICEVPMPEMLAAAACELRGGARRDLLHIVGQLESAVSLATACEQFPSLLDDETILAIRLGEQLDILPDTLNELIELQHNRRLAKAYHPQSTKFYWLSFAFVYLLCCSFVMFSIAPTMKKMLEEFGVMQPWLTQVLFRSADIAAMYWPLFFVVAIVMTINCASPRTERWLLSLFGLLRRVRFYQSPSGITKQLLAVAIDKQRSVQKTLSTLAKYHFHSATRKRLLIARNDKELGTEAWAAIEGTALLQPREVSFLREQSESRMQAYVLRQLAEADWRHRDRVISFRALWINPMMTLLFGGFVALFSIGFFSILVMLIRVLAL